MHHSNVFPSQVENEGTQNQNDNNVKRNHGILEGPGDDVSYSIDSKDIRPGTNEPIKHGNLDMQPKDILMTSQKQVRPGTKGGYRMSQSLQSSH